MGISSPFRSVRFLVLVAATLAVWFLWAESPSLVGYLPVAPAFESDGQFDVEAENHYTGNEGNEGSGVIVPDNSLAFKQQAASGSKYRIGKLTASFGEPDASYEEAIESHQQHNLLQGYPHYILRERMLSGLWSKHAWIMTILGQELAKPEDERLHWIFWHDRDTVIMNPQIPLDIFIPPQDRFPHVHLICNNDRNGLNNGVFLLRVSDWSFKMFASALSMHEYRPDVVLKYTEQSAMEEAIKVSWRQKSVAFVPQRWFNGYPPTGKQNADQHTTRIARPGSMIIHFASNRDGKRPERIAKWHAQAQNRTTNSWDKPVTETMYLQEIEEYWARLERGESQEDIAKDIGKRSWLSSEEKSQLSTKTTKERIQQEVEAEQIDHELQHEAAGEKQAERRRKRRRSS